MSVMFIPVRYLILSVTCFLRNKGLVIDTLSALDELLLKNISPVVSLPVPAVVGMAISGSIGFFGTRFFPKGGHT